jgi:hypothetical protein
MVLPKKLDGALPGLGEQYRVLISRERLLDELAVYGRIARYQDLERFDRFIHVSQREFVA